MGGPRRVSMLLAFALLAACSGGADGGAATSPSTTTTTTTTEPEPTATFPGADWERVGAADAGFDPAALDALAAQAEAAGSQCLVVTRDGVVVDERYWNGATPDGPREAFSVTKSITSTLVGIASDRGLLELDAPAAEHIPAWAGTPAEAVTVTDLLSNDSGRQWSLGIDYGDMLGSPDKTGFSIALAQEQAPGQVWAYNNSAIQTLEAVLQDAVGEEVRDFAESALFEPIGMDDSGLGTDAAGNTLTFMGLGTTCLDLARFGLLAMRDGEWDGEQVVSAEYLEAATGRSSTPLNAAYGYLWWLNRRGALASPLAATTGSPDGSVADGQLVPGAPDDAFWALGFNNQTVAVLPSQGIVAVRLGPKPPDDAPFSESELTTGVLAALTDP